MIKYKLIITSFLVFLFSTSLIGCSIVSDPLFKDETTYPKREKFEDESEQLKLSFIAREMMERDDRLELLKDVQGSEFVKKWNYVNTATTVKMGADLAVGQLSSSLGLGLGSAVMIGSLIWGEIKDGSMETVGQIFLPSVMDGVELKTAEDADAAIKRFTKKQLQGIATEKSWAFECVNDCDGKTAIYTMKVTPGTINEQFIYRPETIVIQLIMMKAEPVEPTNPISAMVGFPVKWMTVQGRSFFINLYSGPVFEENGKIKIGYNEETKIHYPFVQHNIMDTRIGRTILRRFHSTPYTFYGDQDDYPSTFFYKSDIYSFISNSDKRIINKKIIEKDVL